MNYSTGAKLLETPYPSMALLYSISEQTSKMTAPGPSSLRKTLILARHYLTHLLSRIIRAASFARQSHVHQHSTLNPSPPNNIIRLPDDTRTPTFDFENINVNQHRLFARQSHTHIATLHRSHLRQSPPKSAMQLLALISTVLMVLGLAAAGMYSQHSHTHRSGLSDWYRLLASILLLFPREMPAVPLREFVRLLRFADSKLPEGVLPRSLLDPGYVDARPVVWIAVLSPMLTETTGTSEG